MDDNWDVNVPMSLVLLVMLALLVVEADVLLLIDAALLEMEFPCATVVDSNVVTRLLNVLTVPSNVVTVSVLAFVANSDVLLLTVPLSVSRAF